MASGRRTPVSPAPGDTVADAVAGNWVDTRAPARLRPFLRLSRADRPIGTWLLFIPCLWAVMLAANAGGGFYWRDLWIVPSCGLGALLMRGAGCTWNDITDRDLDGAVARTRNRPLPAGEVSLKGALMWMVAQALAAAAILASYDRAAIALGLASLVLVAIYPFAKRFTWWPQVFLGLAFNWGALLAWAAHAGTVPPASVALYLAGICWTLHYDTIYAHQDREDDALIGIRSTARLFGDDSPRWLAGFAIASTALFALSAGLAILPARGWPPLAVALAGVAGFGAHLAWQLRGVDLDDPASCLRMFRANRDAGLVAVPFLAAAALL